MYTSNITIFVVNIISKQFFFLELDVTQIKLSLLHCVSNIATPKIFLLHYLTHFGVPITKIYLFWGVKMFFFVFIWLWFDLRHKEGIWCISVSANARNSINTKMAVNNYIMPQSFRAVALALSCSLSLSLHVLRDATYKWPQWNIIVYSHFCINAIARVGTYWNASDSILMHTSNKSLNTAILRLD